MLYRGLSMRWELPLKKFQNKKLPLEPNCAQEIGIGVKLLLAFIKAIRDCPSHWVAIQQSFGEPVKVLQLSNSKTIVLDPH
jgi:hypothetical protein